MDKNKTILVLDLGTSNIRSNLVDLRTGKVIQSVSIKNQWIKTSAGKSEMNPSLLWESTQKTVAQILPLVKEEHSVECISFSYFGDSLIMTDEKYNPIDHMIMAFDTRAQEEAVYLERKIGKENFREITGSPCFAMLVCSKILWIKDHQPDVYCQTRHFLNIQEFILSKLGLPLYTDYTLANRKMLLDINKKEWSQEILREIGLGASKLGEGIADSTVIVGNIKSFGNVALPYEIPVVLGAHDSECGFLGLGINPDGSSFIGNVSGTYEMVGNFSKGSDWQTKHPAVEFGCGLTKESMLINGSSIAGSYIDWFKQKISKDSDNLFQYMEEAISYDGTGDLLFLANNDKQGFSFDGMNRTTGEQDIYQAIIEGITFKLKGIVDEMEHINGARFEGIRSGGGGSSSDKWLQFKANLLQKEVQRVVNPEVSSVGAAIIAAVGIHYYEGFDQAIDHMVQIGERFTPDKEFAEKYQIKYKKYMDKINLFRREISDENVN
ncbi:MAG: FGGY-family carbohydrate kinase [Suipraeoptans sp.]